MLGANMQCGLKKHIIATRNLFTGKKKKKKGKPWKALRKKMITKQKHINVQKKSGELH